jgi:hypothetical protein
MFTACQVESVYIEIPEVHIEAEMLYLFPASAPLPSKSRHIQPERLGRSPEKIQSAGIRTRQADALQAFHDPAAPERFRLAPRGTTVLAASATM